MTFNLINLIEYTLTYFYIQRNNNPKSNFCMRITMKIFTILSLVILTFLFVYSCKEDKELRSENRNLAKLTLPSSSNLK
jgi:hypothetical protein